MCSPVGLEGLEKARGCLDFCERANGPLAWLEARIHLGARGSLCAFARVLTLVLVLPGLVEASRPFNHQDGG